MSSALAAAIPPAPSPDRPATSTGAAGPPAVDVLRVGGLALRRQPWAGLGVIVDGLVDGPQELGVPGAADYVEDVLLAPAHREAFVALIDEVGLVVCRRSAVAKTATHRDVRGRSSRGRLSQGEYFHHDGCAGPTKPRVVEISCPAQALPRWRRSTTCWPRCCA